MPQWGTNVLLKVFARFIHTNNWEKITRAATDFNTYKFNSQCGRKIEIKVALTLLKVFARFTHTNNKGKQ